MDRREFARKSVLLGAGLVVLKMQNISASTIGVTPKTASKLVVAPNDAKKVFRQKGACSQTYCYLLNREFGNNNADYEKATDLLAGGLAQTGQQCGMLWGATMALGIEAYKRSSNSNDAIGLTIAASQQVHSSFVQNARSPNCKEITGCDFTSKLDTLKYMFKIIFGGMDNSVCFNLAEKWMPDAIKTANESMLLKPAYTQPALSCASEVVRKMGGTEKEIVMVSGYAGGLALSGNACGALAAAIWMNMLKWHLENPDKTSKYFNNPEAKKVLKAFYPETGKEILCSKICKRSFASIDEHTDYVMHGGCKKLIDALAGV
jgi:C_GCAxxG_C_C family probable redox protein